MTLRLGTSRLALLFGAALVIALSVFAAITLETFAVEGNLRALRNAVEIANGRRDSVVAIVDQERGVRAYVSTGDPRFLETYRAGLRLEARIPDLDKDTAARFPQIAERVASARLATRDLEAYFAATVGLVASGRRGEALASYKFGKRKFDLYEERENAVRDAVTADLDRVEVEADDAIREALLFGLLGVVALSIATNFIALELIAERRVERLAERDALTGLANRRLFQVSVERAIVRHARDGSSFALIYLDVDEFKRINDDYSHLVGDEVLQLIGARLAETVRGDDVAARLGGDEFAVLLSEFANDEDPSTAADRIAKALGQPFRVHGTAMEVQCSTGTSTCPADGIDFKTLLLRADERMLAQKLKRREVRPTPERRRKRDRPTEQP